MGWSKDPGPSLARKFLAFFVERILKELSVFIDESGDFGEYSPHSPYYIITMVFHKQDIDIQENVHRLDTELSYLGLDNLCIHTGPIIRKEEIYKDMSIVERRRIFNKMMAFIRSAGIQYKCFSIEKKAHQRFCRSYRQSCKANFFVHKKSFRRISRFWRCQNLLWQWASRSEQASVVRIQRTVAKPDFPKSDACWLQIIPSRRLYLYDGTFKPETWKQSFFKIRDDLLRQQTRFETELLKGT